MPVFWFIVVLVTSVTLYEVSRNYPHSLSILSFFYAEHRKHTPKKMWKRDDSTHTV